MAGPSGQVVSIGMANVRFASPAAAEAARQRQNGKRLRSSIVECLPLAPHLQAQPFAGILNCLENLLPLCSLHLMLQKGSKTRILLTCPHGGLEA